MKINDLTSQTNKLLGKNKQQVSTPSPSNGKEKTRDTLEISSNVKAMEALRAKVLNAADNSERVAAIKEQIASGTYEMDSKKLAEIMLKND
ncbi:MAG: flagellar biosynthesis anti-sigma factor FlgM [Firmicutes bacterium]|nr:flagellar biosynthesis anti-sigma factor FlgM [Bacillota bacterium]